DLKQFVPSEEKSRKSVLRRNTDPDGLQLDRLNREEERRAAEAEAQAQEQRLRTYDEVYQSKSMFAPPTYQSTQTSGQGEGGQQWGTRYVRQYRPEDEPSRLDKARTERLERLDERKVKRQTGPRSDFWDVFDRNAAAER
ncbi:MAG: hypothetical protein AAF191_13620, partial [Verrucomicrobiota bacterium]